VTQRDHTAHVLAEYTGSNKKRPRITDALRSNRVRRGVARSVTGIGSDCVIDVKIANIDARQGSLATSGFSIPSSTRRSWSCHPIMILITPVTGAGS
jgi:hypothetical protein